LTELQTEKVQSAECDHYSGGTHSDFIWQLYFQKVKEKYCQRSAIVTTLDIIMTLEEKRGTIEYQLS
jgi:hypothetical protein